MLQTRIFQLLAFLGLAIMTSPGSAIGAPVPTQEELADARAWTSARFEAGIPTEPPFSFVYDGHESAGLLKKWGVRRTSRKLDANRVRHTLIARDPRTGLEVRCAAIEYRDYPTVEWTLYLKNTGTEDTPLIEKVDGLDARFERGKEGEFTLHHQVGTNVARNDFQPLTTSLPPKTVETLTPSHGRPCAGVWPYFNLEWPHHGAIIVVGWPGKWSAQFVRDTGAGLWITAGQETTRFRLKPGEEVRSPLVVVQLYRGEPLRAQNIWRRWMLAYSVPRPLGKLPPTLLLACSSHQFGEMIHADEASQKLFVDRYLNEGLKLDYWWMDAGWYINKTGWPNTGTWEVDPKRFPHGLRAITDHAHARGVKSIVWFEPERVTPGTWLYTKHPEWLLGKDGDQKLLDLGNPDARAWVTDHVDGLLRKQGIDLYRQDYNVDPLPYWRAADTENREGITENHYVTGYLAYWDALRRRHPGMLIDSCASGGHRNDLETMRRSIPLLRSDFIQDSVGNQGHTYGLAFWLPYFGTGTDQQDAYGALSAMTGTSFTACWDMRDRSLNYDRFRKMVGEYRRVAPENLGDFYPLTPYNLDSDQWIAWQFDRPEAGTGAIRAFRRDASPYESAQLRLQGLDPAASYTVTNLDTGTEQVLHGRELMESGLAVAIRDRPGAAVYIYKKR